MDARATRPFRRRLRMLRLLIALTNPNYEQYNIESRLGWTDAVRAWNRGDLLGSRAR